MEALSRPQAIIDFCLAPLELDAASGPTIEVRRRLEHVIKTFQAKAARPLSVRCSVSGTFRICTIRGM